MEQPNGGVPPLLAEVEVSNLAGFDVTPTPPAPSSQVSPLERVLRRSEVVFPPLDSPFQAPGYRSVQPHSISLPASPRGFGPAVHPDPVPGAGGESHDLRRQAMMANAASEQNAGGVRLEPAPPPQGKVVFRSQPMPAGRSGSREAHGGGGMRAAMSRDRRYDSFKTFSGKLERQLTYRLASAPECPVEEDEGDDDAIDGHRAASLPKVDRFFAALEGPELDKLRSSENLVLLLDKTWPFLLRFPVSAFGIVSSASAAKP